MLVLRAEDPAMDGQEWQIDRGPALLGRSHTCDVVLAHDSVSRQHARIVRTPQGFTVEDLASQNWTFVNNQRVTTPRPLSGGDRLVVGKVPLSVELVEAPEVLALPEGFEPPGITIMVDVDEALAEAETAPTAAPVPRDDPPTEELVGRGRVGPPATSGEPAESAPSTPTVASQPGKPHRERPASATIQPANETVTPLEALGPALGQLARLQQGLVDVRDLIETAGGRPAVVALIEEARLTAANPLDVRQLMQLGQMAESAAALLQAELALLDLLAPSAE
jgi:predicted component of type VI protein secretion system